MLLFSSCAHDTFAGNAFLNNDYPVALDMRRSENVFDDGARGNYWDGSAPYDLDANGVSGFAPTVCVLTAVAVATSPVQLDMPEPGVGSAQL